MILYPTSRRLSLELPSGVRTIVSVPTSIAAFLGRAPRGPVDEPVTVTGYGDYERIFGGLHRDSTISYAVRDFFLNGGGQVEKFLQVTLNPDGGARRLDRALEAGSNLVRVQKKEHGAPDLPVARPADSTPGEDPSSLEADPAQFKKFTGGADQLADDYKYVPVRRLALWIEETLNRATQWAVFEPNDEPLWSQLRLNIGAFLQDLFRQGAFQGQRPGDAYFVQCDSTTTTQSDINRGIVNIVVGFAPLKPAEFVILYLQQRAGTLAV